MHNNILLWQYFGTKNQKSKTIHIMSEFSIFPWPGSPDYKWKLNTTATPTCRYIQDDWVVLNLSTANLSTEESYDKALFYDV